MSWSQRNPIGASLIIIIVIFLIVLLSVLILDKTDSISNKVLKGKQIPILPVVILQSNDGYEVGNIYMITRINIDTTSGWIDSIVLDNLTPTAP